MIRFFQGICLFSFAVAGGLAVWVFTDHRTFDAAQAISPPGTEMASAPPPPVPATPKKLASGASVTARLVVLATGMSAALGYNLGITRL